MAIRWESPHTYENRKGTTYGAVGIRLRAQGECVWSFVHLKERKHVFDFLEAIILVCAVEQGTI